MQGIRPSTFNIGERTQAAGARAATGLAPAVSRPEQADVAVIGAGLIGLSIAWGLARRGLSVAVFEKSTVGAGASLAATGMLAGAAELEPGGEELLALALESQRLWPAFAGALEAEAGHSVDYRDQGTLVVALTRDEIERLRFRYDLHRRCGLPTRWLGGNEVRALESGLRPSVAAGLFCPDDHQVDPSLVMAALRSAILKAGVRLVEHCAVEALDLAAGRVNGVVTAEGICRANTVVLATGAWAGDDKLLPAGLRLPVHPLKGQSLALRTTPTTGTLTHIVWTEQVHLAPKGDGRLIVGASVEECGFDDAITAGGVFALLEAARRALPSMEEMQVDAIWCGFRPTSMDDAPILGATPVEGLVVATGHHRNGYLLAPVTAEAIAKLVTDGALPAVASPFGIERFHQPARVHRQVEKAE